MMIIKIKYIYTLLLYKFKIVNCFLLQAPYYNRLYK